MCQREFWQVEVAPIPRVRNLCPHRKVCLLFKYGQFVFKDLALKQLFVSNYLVKPIGSVENSILHLHHNRDAHYLEGTEVERKLNEPNGLQGN